LRSFFYEVRSSLGSSRNSLLQTEKFINKTGPWHESVQPTSQEFQMVLSFGFLQPQFYNHFFFVLCVCATGSQQVTVFWVMTILPPSSS